jgi:hypothetical protein
VVEDTGRQPHIFRKRIWCLWLSISPVQADEFFRDIKPVGSKMMADAEKFSSMAVICRKLDQHDLGFC